MAVMTEKLYGLKGLCMDLSAVENEVALMIQMYV